MSELYSVNAGFALLSMPAMVVALIATVEGAKAETVTNSSCSIAKTVGSGEGAMTHK